MEKLRPGPKPTGSIKKDKGGFWIARLTWTDESGKRRDIKRRCATKADAQDLRWRLVKEHEARSRARGYDPATLTVAVALAKYEEHHLHQAEFSHGRKISGLKSPKGPKLFLGLFVARFGNRLLKSITRSDLETFRRERAAVPTERGPRSLATLNRELAAVRAAFRFAVAEQWIEKSPFDGGKLIEPGGETKRERILSPAEESRLLEVCRGPRAHLRLIVEIALDTAMRHGEILKLAWEDLDFGTGTIRVQAGNTKTQETRQLGMTSRVRKGLLAERLAGGSATGKIFPFARIEKALKTACRLAGIEGLRFHDLRHTAITRMVNAGLPPAQIMKLSGHHQWGTFLRYVNPDGATATAAAEALDRFNQK